MRTYGRLLRRPTAALSLSAALLSAVPIGMWPLAVVLLALRADGGAAAAGLLAALFGVGNAAGVLVQGALLLRLPAARLLPGFALLALPAAALLVIPGGGAAGAVLAGLSIPAVTPAVRGRFAATLPDVDRPGAYALVNVLFQVGIAVGPLLVAGVASIGGIGWAPAIAAAFGVSSAAVLAAVHRGVPSTPAPRVSKAGPTGSSRRGSVVLIGGAVTAGFGIGVLQVLVPLRAGAPVAGAVFAALALAEVGGAVLLGVRARLRHAGALLVAGSAVMATMYAAVGASVGPVVLLAVVLGAATAAQSLGSALLLDRVVSAGRLPAVFAVQIAALVLATAVGAYVAGRFTDAAAPTAAGLLLAASALALGVLRVLRRRPAIGPRARAS